jgi:hypothetical protein
MRTDDLRPAARSGLARADIGKPDPERVELAAAIQKAIAAKAKPIGSLGRLEDLAVAIGLAAGTLKPDLGTARLIVFAGDHGLTAENVTSYPSSITREVAQLMLAGKAGANICLAGITADLIVVDYLQLMRSPSKKGQENRQVEVAEISGGIKALAKELKVPVIVLAQLNRNPDARPGATKGKPNLSDLRESGAIEQDADLVGLLWREAYYLDGDEKKEDEGKADLIIAKHRNGEVGTIPLTFIDSITRFEDRAPENMAPPA